MPGHKANQHRGNKFIAGTGSSISICGLGPQQPAHQPDQLVLELRRSEKGRIRPEGRAYRSGEREAVARCKPVCAASSSTTLGLGDDPGLAMHAKPSFNYFAVSNMKLMGRIHAYRDAVGMDHAFYGQQFRRFGWQRPDAGGTGHAPSAGGHGGPRTRARLPPPALTRWPGARPRRLRRRAARAMDLALWQRRRRLGICHQMVDFGKTADRHPAFHPDLG